MLNTDAIKTGDRWNEEWMVNYCDASRLYDMRKTVQQSHMKITAK